MPVFKRPGATVYSYDFRLRGKRFSGSTGCANKRAAERFEEDRRREVEADRLNTTKPLTMADAAFLYWQEVGQHHADPSGPERNLAWLQSAIGKHTLVADITDAMVARLVAKRRGEGVKNATVNRSMIEPLRTILRRAERVWGAKIQRIDWRSHRLKEPQERVREASAVEEDALIEAVPEDYRPLVRFALLTGCRRGEIVGLTWQAIFFATREFRVTGKGDQSRTIPMTAEVYNLLWSLKDHHPVAVFTFVAARTRKDHDRIKGQRYPITAEGLHTVWHRHVAPKVGDFRFHDTRHTAATRLVRATGSLKMAQRLLGHTTIATTTRYAHVTHDDLRNGLESVAGARRNTQNATTTSAQNAKMLKENGE